MLMKLEQIFKIWNPIRPIKSSKPWKGILINIWGTHILIYSYNPNVSILNLPKNKIVKLQVNNCPDQQDIFNKKLMNKLFIEQ